MLCRDAPNVQQVYKCGIVIKKAEKANSSERSQEMIQRKSIQEKRVPHKFEQKRQ